jgi:Tfp pilus assembly protein PilO
MTAPWRPWQAKVLVWLPTVLLCAVCLATYLWQSSGSAGRESRLRQSIAKLESEIDRLEKIREQAAGERDQVRELDRQFNHLYESVFRTLDDRLTEILMAVGRATREAGLLPSSFNYSADENKRLRHVRFGIQFSVVGEYSQIRHLLSSLQASPQFLIVEHLSLSGEDETASRELSISLKLATLFAEADQELLRRLTGGLRTAEDPE